jgi:hypothetical protein
MSDKTTTAAGPKFVSITEAAKRCGVSRQAIFRRLQSGQLRGAIRADTPRGARTGRWLIPVDMLPTASFQPAVHPESPPAAASNGKSEAEAERLRCERDEWRRRAEVAEERARGAAALAAERAERIEELSWALRRMKPPAIGLASQQGSHSMQGSAELISTTSQQPARAGSRWRRSRSPQ